MLLQRCPKFKVHTNVGFWIFTLICVFTLNDSLDNIRILVEWSNLRSEINFYMTFSTVKIWTKKASFRKNSDFKLIQLTSDRRLFFDLTKSPLKVEPTWRWGTKSALTDEQIKWNVCKLDRSETEIGINYQCLSLKQRGCDLLNNDIILFLWWYHHICPFLKNIKAFQSHQRYYEKLL